MTVPGRALGVGRGVTLAAALLPTGAIYGIVVWALWTFGPRIPRGLIWTGHWAWAPLWTFALLSILAPWLLIATHQVLSRPGQSASGFAEAQRAARRFAWTLAWTVYVGLYAQALVLDGTIRAAGLPDAVSNVAALLVVGVLFAPVVWWFGAEVWSIRRVLRAGLKLGLVVIAIAAVGTAITWIFAQVVDSPATLAEALLPRHVRQRAPGVISPLAAPGTRNPVTDEVWMMAGYLGLAAALWIQAARVQPPQSVDVPPGGGETSPDPLPRPEVERTEGGMVRRRFAV